MKSHFHTPTAPELPVGTRTRIPRPRIYSDELGWKYEFEVLLEVPGAEPLTLGGAWFRSDQVIAPITGDSNAALVASLLPLMMVGVPVVVEGRMSPQLLHNLQLFQAAFADWFPGLQQIEIECESLAAAGACLGEAPSGRGEGVMFSLGVDSWYSLMSHFETVDYLVFIDGFDLTSEQAFARRDMRDAVHDAARAVGKPVITVESNLRNWLDRWMDWVVPHGTFLGAVAMLLEGNLERLWLPSSDATWTTWDNGTNAFTDPLYATERLWTIYDGGDRQRIGKLVCLLDQPLAMDNLRVCWSGTRGRMNCGECPKCVRTMAALHLLGGLERARLFEGEIGPEEITQLRVTDQLRLEWQVTSKYARILGVENDPVAKVMETRFRNYHASQLLDPEAGGLATLNSEDDWHHLARSDREGFAKDFREHAPGVVSKVLEAAVDKAPREVFKALWKKDHRWLQRELEKISRSGG